MSEESVNYRRRQRTVVTVEELQTSTAQLVEAGDRTIISWTKKKKLAIKSSPESKAESIERCEFMFADSICLV